MTQDERIRKLAEDNELTLRKAKAVYEDVFAIIGSELEKGENYRVIGFGTFELRDRAARKGRNPQTGEEIDIPAQRTVGFKPSKAVKEAVN